MLAIKGALNKNLHIEVAVQDSEAEIEAELLLGRKLRNVLDMFKLKRMSFLLFQRVLLLFLTIQGFIPLPINTHAFEYI